MRRLFIIRKDLHLSSGKLAAQVGHCAELYWLNLIKESVSKTNQAVCETKYAIDKDIFENYICGDFVKTICQARNKPHLLKAVDIAKELGLVENVDFGLIYDKCYTELEPEETDGTTLTGIWFKPLDDKTSHLISKKYHLYVD